MKFCCGTFEDFTEMAGEGGLSVVVALLLPGSMRFFLQSRAFAAGVSVTTPVTDARMVLSTQEVIHYCPGCGVKLLDFYASTLGDLQRQDLLLEWSADGAQQ
jgi:hypothetical protein